MRTALGREPKAPVRIASTLALPYRCLGPLVFTLQRLGATKIQFVAEPPPEDGEP